MQNLPATIILVLRHFDRALRDRVGEWAKVLLIGAILAPGQRTVTAALRVMGLSTDRQFHTYHRVVSRAPWSSYALRRILLHLLIRTFVPDDAVVVVGLDATIERRRGSKIAAKGIDRDPVRSSTECFVKTSGVRWVSMQLVVPIPWATRIWALPFLTVLAPSERDHQPRAKRHKKLTDWGRQMILPVRRWLPTKRLVVLADSTYAALELLARWVRLAPPVVMITRLRMDAALYDPVPQHAVRPIGRPRRKGKRQPTLDQRVTDPSTCWMSLNVRWYGGALRRIEVATATAVRDPSGMVPVPIGWGLIGDPAGRCAPQAFRSTDLTNDAQQLVEWFVVRWHLEVTFHEVRTHVGVEPQRQWSALAILRTTPALVALFSLVPVCAHQVLDGHMMPLRQATWDAKAPPTFVDTLAVVRQHLWPVTLSYMSCPTPAMVHIPRALLERLTDTLAFAA